MLEPILAAAAAVVTLERAVAMALVTVLGKRRVTNAAANDGASSSQVWATVKYLLFRCEWGWSCIVCVCVLPQPGAEAYSCVCVCWHP